MYHTGSICHAQDGNIFCNHPDFYLYDVFPSSAEIWSVCEVKSGVSIIINKSPQFPDRLTYLHASRDQFQLIFNTFTDLIFSVVF